MSLNKESNDFRYTLSMMIYTKVKISNCVSGFYFIINITKTLFQTHIGVQNFYLQSYSKMRKYLFPLHINSIQLLCISILSIYYAPDIHQIWTVHVIQICLRVAKIIHYAVNKQAKKSYRCIVNVIQEYMKSIIYSQNKQFHSGLLYNLKYIYLMSIDIKQLFSIHVYSLAIQIIGFSMFYKKIQKHFKHCVWLQTLAFLPWLSALDRSSFLQ